MVFSFPVLFLLYSCRVAADDSPHRRQVRIQIKKSLSQVTVSGTDIKRKIYQTGDIRSYVGKKTIKFNCRGPKRKSRGGVMMASLSSRTGLLKVEGKHYRGTIDIISSDEGNRCNVINKTDMENYIGALLTKEVSSAWPPEALKAQAVAARSYAIYMMRSQRVSRQKKRNAFYDLESSEKHQVGGSFFDITHKTARAAYQTRGQILVNKKNAMTPIFYHAKCGGKVLAPHQVWQNKIFGYTSNFCRGCRGRGQPPWQKKIEHSHFYKFISWLQKKKMIALKNGFGVNKNIQISSDNFFNNKFTAVIGGQSVAIKKPLLRRFFGRRRVPSNNFKVEWKQGALRLMGKGLGHGVGMCQIGALGMAEEGWSFQEILSHYFPGHKLAKIY